MRNLTLIFLAACSGSSNKTTTEPAPAAEQNPSELAVVQAMNPEADACVDFYEYACGGWEDSTELPPDRSIVTRSFTTIFDENQEIIHEILENAAKDPGEDPVAQKLGAYYGACMDTEAIDAAGAEPLQPWLKKIEEAERKDLWKLMGQLTAFGPNPLFGGAVWADDKNPDMNIIHLGQDGLGMPDRSYYLDLDEKGEARKADYQTAIAEMLVLAGVEEAEAKSDAEKIVAFETELAKIQWERAALRDSEKTYNKMSMDEFAALTPSVDYAAYFEGFGMKSDALNVRTPSYFEGLEAVVSGADDDLLKAYLRWHTVSWAAPYLHSELDQRNFAFFGKQLSGQEEQQPRWKRCVSRTESAMGEWLGKAYVDKKFAGDSKEQAEAMVAGIFTAFEGNLPNLAWMDDTTRERAIEKARAFVAKLGYPKKYRDYSALEASADSHFSNVVNAGNFTMAYYAAKVDQPVDKDEWHMTPQMVNAYYNPAANEIVFPAGIMQPPFFDRTFPKAMNYGALGMVIGHELTHGFDDEGRKYAPTGELKEWWEPEVSERFEERAQCVVDQYAGFEVQPGLNVNGELTLGENIADIGGLKMSYLAYRAYVDEHGEEPEYAGLTGDQQVFVAFAQGWCSIAKPEIIEQRVKTDPHSPPRYRVNGTVMNTPQFAKAFGCEKGQPMAPEDACEVW